MEQIDKLTKILKLINEQIKIIADMCLNNQKAIVSIAETQQLIAKALKAKNN